MSQLKKVFFPLRPEDVFVATTNDKLIEIAWIKQLGSSLNDDALGIATDGIGNVYVTGLTDADMPGGEGSAGYGDAWIAKYNTNGTCLWLKQLGSSSNDIGNGIATDGIGNIYITGLTFGEMPEGGGNAGYGDAWLAKYDSKGNRLWLKQLGSAADDAAYSIATDRMGNVYITGSTSGEMPDGGGSAGDGDAWLAKYDTNGNRLWLKQLGSSSLDHAFGIATDGNSNVYLTGATFGEMPEGGGSAGNWDAWLAKYDTDGNRLWLKQLGSSSADQAKSIATDGVGKVYVTGSTWGEMPGGGGSAGNWDAWVAKYDTNGNCLWLNQLGSSSTDQANGIATDGIGNVYVTGSTFGEMPEGGGSAGGKDAWVAKYNTDGKCLWLKQLGSSSSDDAFAIATDGLGNVYITGSTWGEMAANEGSTGFRDAWLAKLG